NLLAAAANLEAIEKFFYVDAYASVYQTYINPFGPRPPDNINVTGNRTTARTLALNPYFQGVVAHDITYLLRNNNTWTNANNSQLNNARTTEWIGHAE